MDSLWWLALFTTVVLIGLMVLVGAIVASDGA